MTDSRIRPLTYGTRSGFQVNPRGKIHYLYGSAYIQRVVGSNSHVWTFCGQAVEFDTPRADPFSSIWAPDQVTRILERHPEQLCKRCAKFAVKHTSISQGA